MVLIVASSPAEGSRQNPRNTDYPGINYNACDPRNSRNPPISANPTLGNHHLSGVTAGMLSIGGTVGTGLFFSTAALLRLGPLVALLSVAYVAFLVSVVVSISGELAAYMPGTGLLCEFLTIYLSPPIGLANNCIYCLSWGLTFALELSILTEMVRNWWPWADNHPSTVLFVLWGSLFALNLLPVDIYGRVELWLALIKVVAIVVWMLVVTLTVLGRWGTAGPLPLTLWWQHWPRGLLGDSAGGPVAFAVAAVNAVIYCSFLFQSVESVAITTGDLDNVQDEMPFVISLVLVRIVAFYVACVFLLAITVDCTQLLAVPSSESPFMVSLRYLGFCGKSLLWGFDVVIFSAILSAANSNVYFGSRCLAAVVEPKFPSLAKTSNYGVPAYTVAITSSIGLVAFLLRFHAVSVVFGVLLTCCALAGLLMWCCLCCAYTRFHWGLVENGQSRDCLPYRARLDLPRWAPFVAGNIIFILLFSGATNWWAFSWLQFVASYTTPLLFGLLWLVFSYNCGETSSPRHVIGEHVMLL